MDTKFVEGNLCLCSVEHPEMTEERKIQKVRWARERAHRVCLRNREEEEMRKGGREKRKGRFKGWLSW